MERRSPKQAATQNTTFVLGLVFEHSCRNYYQSAANTILASFSEVGQHRDIFLRTVNIFQVRFGEALAAMNFPATALISLVSDTWHPSSSGHDRQSWSLYAYTD
jgi:hypothetical protein